MEKDLGVEYMKKSSDMAQYMAEKFHKLKKEGYPQKQRVAIAMNMAREHGYNVGPKPDK